MSSMKQRGWTIRKQDAGKTAAQVVAAVLRVPKSQAAAIVRQGHVRIDGHVWRKPELPVRPGQRLTVAEGRPLPPRPSKPPKVAAKATAKRPRPAEATGIKIVYQDQDLIIVDKPPGLTTVRHADEVADAGAKSRFLPPTLLDVLPKLVSGPTQGRFRIRAVHRLDRDTSGLVAFARNVEAESSLGKQFRAHATERRYLALVRGVARDTRIESQLMRDRGDGRRGSGASGQRAVTHVKVLQTWDGFSLVECRLETGRTHQVRIHLGEQGTPLCGERIYDRPLHGKPHPDTSGASRPMLHAQSLGLVHPRTGKTLSWTAEPPRDFRELVERFGKVM
jgi:23S rRNA pseudouridine1911/1915/1917 synthase